MFWRPTLSISFRDRHLRKSGAIVGAQGRLTSLADLIKIELDRRTSMNDAVADWPALPYATWRETAATLQLWTQIVGKVRLALTPWLNHGWQVPLYVTARGLGTSPIPFRHEILEMEFDFISHCLVIRTSRGEQATLPLEPQT